MVGITVTSKLAGFIGQAISNARTGSHIPQDCRQPLSSKVAYKKWKDQAWQLAIHTSCSLWELRLLVQNPQWWTDPTTIFDPCPDTVHYGLELQLFYVVQLSLWILTGASCKWLEERRKDYVEMMVHHVLTVGLILNSFICNELAIGLVVLTVHDTSDVVLDLMKMCNYLKLEGLHGFFFTELLFVSNTYVTWVYMRLYYFPRYLIAAISYGPYRARCGNDGSWPGSSYYSGMMLHALLVLHWVWFLLLNQIGFRILYGQAPNKAGDKEYEISMNDQNKSLKHD